MREAAFYQRHRETVFQRAKGYYENNKEVITEKAKNKYRKLSEEIKNIKRALEEIDIKICLKKGSKD